MAKTSVLTILIQLAKKGAADREVIKGLAELKANVGLAMGAFAAFTGVAIGVGKALGVAVTAFTDYAAQVRDLGRITGTGAEETSKLIQAADDLTISYESLQKALWFASKNGIEVNIDSLARLADEYVALGSASEQAAFLAQKFGKGGAEMGKLLEKGGTGVRSMTDAISGSLVLTDEAVVAAREYEMQVDQLNDSWLAFKVTIGSGVVPELNKMLWGLNNNAAIMEEYNRLVEEGTEGTGDQIRALAIQNVQIQQYTDGLDSAGLSYRSMAEAAQQGALANQDFGMSIEEITSKNKDLLSLTMDLQAENESYTQKQDELKIKLSELVAEQDKYYEGGRKWKEVQGEIDATKGSIDELAAAHEEAGNKIAFSLLQQKMAADGLSDAEFEALLVMGQQWGIIDEKVAESAILMDKNAQAMAASLATPDGQLMDIVDKANNLAKRSGESWTFYVNIIARGGFPNLPRGNESGPGAGWNNNAAMDQEFDLGMQGQASGGPLGSGITIVGEGASGWSPTAELIVNGMVIPHSAAQWMKDSGILDGAAHAMYGSTQDLQEAHAVYAGRVDTRRARRRARSVAPAISASQSSGPSEGAVLETVSTATEVAAAAAQTSAAVQQRATVEATQTRKTIQEGNDNIAGKLDEMNELLKQQNSTLQRSIVAAVQQVAP